MNNDRRILAWLAIASSLVLCLPCFCIGFFLLAAAFISWADSSYAWTGGDTALAVVSGVMTLGALATGLLLAGLGTHALVKNSSPAK